MINYRLINMPPVKRTPAQALRRLMPSIFFPTVFFGLIFWDWNTTRLWKLEQKSLQEKQ